MSNDNNRFRYRLVHEVAKIAQQLENEDRNPIDTTKNNYYKEVNKSKVKRNYVLEAYEILMKQKADEE